MMDELRKQLEAHAVGKDFHFNPDAELVEGLLRALTKRKEKFGRAYCPCRVPSGDVEKDGDIVCPCAFHVDEIARDGHCHCYLFVK